MRSPLHPQHHHGVGVRQRFVEAVGHRGRPVLDPDREQRRRGDQGDLGPRCPAGGRWTGPPAVEDVAHDRDAQAGQVTGPFTEVAPDREGVEQGLRGVFGVPSPALTTAPSIQPASASRCGAPDAPWRMTTASAPMACNVRAVSFNVSPLDTDDPLAEKLITSADRRFAAASNEIRVRVESSKKIDHGLAP